MALNVSKNTSTCQSFQLSIFRGNLSVKKILTETLQKWAIDFSSVPDLPTIAVYRLKNSPTVIYRSSIALSLQRSTNLSSLAIANILLNYLSQLHTTSQPVLDFTVEKSDRSFLDFHLSDRSIALWLQLLSSSVPLPFSPSPPLSPPRNVFPIQYVHARCCSILRLAEQEGLITLKSPNWFATAPILAHPAELNLIDRLLQVTDAKASSQPQDWFKLATFLSEAAIELHRLCPIWDKTDPNFPELARARLGLISLTQYFLKSLLQDRMGVVAISEL